jgi:hypothetical protein
MTTRSSSTPPFTYRSPSIEELYAFELEARRLRAEAISEAFRNGVKAVRAFFARPVAPQGTRTVRHA